MKHIQKKLKRLYFSSFDLEERELSMMNCNLDAEINNNSSSSSTNLSGPTDPCKPKNKLNLRERMRRFTSPNSKKSSQQPSLAENELDCDLNDGAVVVPSKAMLASGGGSVGEFVIPLHCIRYLVDGHSYWDFLHWVINNRIMP